ncbi:MAG: hypothetical protein L0K22_05840, partial [Lacticaseibacillus paracasei]|nr:hypothetical protein [Lacticaseibacillus paracasei]
RRHSVPAPSGRRLRSLARQESFSLATFYDYSEFNESQVLQGNYGSASFFKCDPMFFTYIRKKSMSARQGEL